MIFPIFQNITVDEKTFQKRDFHKNTIISVPGDIGFKNCDISFPGIIATDSKNPCNFKYRMLDGSHRMLKMWDNNIHESFDVPHDYEETVSVAIDMMLFGGMNQILYKFGLIDHRDKGKAIGDNYWNPRENYYNSFVEMSLIPIWASPIFI